MITQVEKNLVKMLLTDEIDILIHSCHCQSFMPFGLGQEIETTFPEAKVAHYKFYSKNNKEGKMLGEFSEAVLRIREKKKVIINLYTHRFPGPFLLESHMRVGLIKVFNKYGFSKKDRNPIRYGIPVIGEEWSLMTSPEMELHLYKIKDYMSSRRGDFDNFRIFLKV